MATPALTRCRLCRLLRTPAPPPDVQIAKWKGCADRNEYCAAWAASGECDNNAAYMHTHCKVSCKLCTAKDREEEEGQGAAAGAGEAAAAA